MFRFGIRTLKNLNCLQCVKHFCLRDKVRHTYVSTLFIISAFYKVFGSFSLFDMIGSCTLLIANCHKVHILLSIQTWCLGVRREEECTPKGAHRGKIMSRWQSWQLCFELLSYTHNTLRPLDSSLPSCSHRRVLKGSWVSIKWREQERELRQRTVALTDITQGCLYWCLWTWVKVGVDMWYVWYLCRYCINMKKSRSMSYINLRSGIFFFFDKSLLFTKDASIWPKIQ